MKTFYPRNFFPWMQCVLPTDFTPSKLANDGVIDDPQVELLDSELWEKFSEIGTEMVINKQGRRTFPKICVNITGLNKHSNYYVLMDLVSTDPCRYKFAMGEWLPAGTADPPFPPRPFFHPDGPMSGEVWMRKGADFNKMKLTNNMSGESNMMLLNSLHKYLPRLHFIRCDTLGHPILSTLKSFNLHQTAFYAVTAYQNTRITDLKIETNPFAKGFRKDGNGKRDLKRKIEQQKHMAIESEAEEENPSKQLKPCEKEQTMGNIHPDLMVHWHLALLRFLGGSSMTKMEKSTKKKGFDVSDILGDT